MTDNTEPQFDNWKDAWEYNARQTRDALDNYSEDQLLAIISDGRSDLYYQIWEVIGNKGTKSKAPMVLIKYLEENMEDCMDLSRAHCLEALFKIIKLKDQASIDDFNQRITQICQEPKNQTTIRQGIEDLKQCLINYNK